MTTAGRAATALSAATLVLALALAPAVSAQAVPLPSGSLSGIIRDSTGTAIVDAQLRLTSGSDHFSANSTAGGAYSIASLPAGDYLAQLAPPAGSPQYSFTEFPFSVTTGSNTFNPVLGLRSSIEGVVTDGSAAPVPGVLVSVYQQDYTRGVSNGPDGTLADGAFDFGVDPDQGYYVSFAPPDGSDLEYQWHLGAHSLAAATLFQPRNDGAGSPFDASVVLATNTTQITGTVTLGGVPGSGWIVLTNSSGEYIAQLGVGAGGAFSTAGVPAGTYLLQALDVIGDQNYASQLQAVTVGISDTVSPDLVLVPSGPRLSSVGVSDSYTATRNTVLTVPAGTGVTSNDSRTPPGQLWAVLDEEPAHGTVFLQYDGGFSYAPADGFTGTDTFTYQPSPFQPNFGAGGDPTTVTITVVAALAATGTALDATAPALAVLAILAGLAVVVAHRRPLAP